MKGSLLFCILIFAYAESFAHSCETAPVGKEPAEVVTLQKGTPTVQPVDLAKVNSPYITAEPPPPHENQVRRYPLHGTISSEAVMLSKINLDHHRQTKSQDE